MFCTNLGATVGLAAIFYMCGVYGESAPTTVIPKRQDTPGPATTSINWWPYPSYASWGQPTAASITDPVTLVPVTSFIAAASLSTDGPATISTPALTTPTSTTTNAANVTSNGSMIYITALPPAATPRQNYKRPTKSSLNIAYLAPLFAVVGVVAGVLLAWLAFYCARGRWAPRRRASSFRYGPQYVPPSERIRVAGIPATGDEENRGSRFLGMIRHGRQSLRESMFKGNSQRPSWAQRGISAHNREAAAASHIPMMSQDMHDTPGRADRSAMESEPFLPSNAPASQARSPGVPMSAHNSRSPSVRSPQGTEVFSDEEEAAVPYDTLRHKSIRRGILDRLKTGSRYRKGHKKADSDVQVEQLLGAGGSPYAPVTCVEERTASRASTSCATSTEGLPLSLARYGSSGPGFRIVQEDTDSLPSPSQEGGMLGLTWTLPWVASPDKLGTDDRFTALPSRKSLMEKRNSPSPGVSRTSSTSSKVDPERASLIDAHTAMLPSSPPRVTSPPLEAQLFFGAIPQKFGSTPQLDFNFPRPNQHVVASSPLAGSPRSKTKKLSSRRGPPLLPFPSSGSRSPYRNRLTKTPSQRSTPHEDGSTTPTGKTRTPAERFAERHDALNKVDEIIAKSWSARDLRGEERASSPTMFGAVASTDAGTMPQGIEQRLFTQERS